MTLQNARKAPLRYRLCTCKAGHVRESRSFALGLIVGIALLPVAWAAGQLHAEREALDR